MPDSKVHLILFAAALAFRSIFLLEISDMPTFSHPVMDEGYHLELANQILSGSSGVAETPYYRAPLYPYFFTALLWLGDGSLFFVRLVQILLGSLLPGLIFLIGRTLFERRVALLAAGAATVFPTFLYYDSSLLITGLIVFLSALVIWQTLRAGRAPTPRNFILLGALIGLAALARPNVLFYLPALGLWFWFCIRPLFHHRLKNTLTAYAIVIAAALAVIAPVTIRNWVVSGDFIFISWQGGYNFFLGNNHLATGWSATAPGIKSTWQGGYLDAINLARAETGEALSEKEIDNYWWRRGWEEVGDYPAVTAGLMAKKTLFLISGYEIPNNQNIYLVEKYSRLAELLFWREPFYFPSGLVLPLALLGLGLSIRRWRKHAPLYLFLLSYSASVVLFFVCARYRQPVLPIILLFAAYGACELFRRARQANWRHLTISSVSALALGVLCNTDIIALDRDYQDATDEFLLGSAHQLQGQTAEAEIRFREALKHDPSFLDAHINLGLIAATGGRKLEAERSFTAALRIDPNSPLALTNLAMLYMTSEKLDDARRLLERARDIDQLDYNVHYRLGLVYHLQESYENARDSYLEALKLNPDYEPILQNLKIVEGVLQDR